MITYWTFTGQFNLFAWFFGMPLLYIVGTILMMIWLEGNHGIHLQTLTVFISVVVMDLVVGGLGAMRAHRKIKLSTSWIGSTLVVAGCSIAIAMPLIKDFTDRPMSQWGKASVMGRDGALFWEKRGFGPTYTDGEIFVAYGVSDVAAAKKGIREDNDISLEPITYLDPLMTRLDGLQVSVVDNQFQIAGFGSEFDGLFVIVVGHASYDDQTGEGRTLENSDYRVLAYEFFDLSKADIQRGHVNLPVNFDQHMTKDSAERLLLFPDSKKVHMQRVDNAI